MSWRHHAQKLATCSQCGVQWMTSQWAAKKLCHSCATRKGMNHRKELCLEPQLSAAQVEAMLDEAIANEMRMPWERTK